MKTAKQCMLTGMLVLIAALAMVAPAAADPYLGGDRLGRADGRLGLGRAGRRGSLLFLFAATGDEPAGERAGQRNVQDGLGVWMTRHRFPPVLAVTAL